MPVNHFQRGAVASRNLGWRTLLLRVRCSEAHRPTIEDEMFPHSRHHQILPCYTTPHCINTTRHCINTTPHHTTPHCTALLHSDTTECFPTFPKHLHMRNNNSRTVPTLVVNQDSKYMNNSVIRSLFQAQWRNGCSLLNSCFDRCQVPHLTRLVMREFPIIMYVFSTLMSSNLVANWKV